MGNYGTNTYTITFANPTLAEIFLLDLQTIDSRGDAFAFEYELTSPNEVYIFSPEQEKVSWICDTPSKTLEKFIGKPLHLSANLLDNKTTTFEVYSESQDWFWDYVDGEKIISWAGLDESNVPENLDLDEMLGDWAYESEWIYEDECIACIDKWENGVLTCSAPNLTDEIYRSMAKSFREYFEENKYEVVV